VQLKQKTQSPCLIKDYRNTIKKVAIPTYLRHVPHIKSMDHQMSKKNATKNLFTDSQLASL